MSKICYTLSGSSDFNELPEVLEFQWKLLSQPWGWSLKRHHLPRWTRNHCLLWSCRIGQGFPLLEYTCLFNNGVLLLASCLGKFYKSWMYNYEENWLTSKGFQLLLLDEPLWTCSWFFELKMAKPEHPEHSSWQQLLCNLNAEIVISYGN